MANAAKLKTVMSSHKTAVDNVSGYEAKMRVITGTDIGEHQKYVLRVYAFTGNANELKGFDWS